MSATAEKHEFQTEAKQLLDLMVHSVYSHKEIFLRELISNASDALDKLRFEAVRNTSLSAYTADPHVRITADKTTCTLTVDDNGIGMSRQEVVDFIGTIAKSGTREFARLLQEAKSSDLPPEMIGQFGVGFYSSFMVADRVVLITRKAGEDGATRWESSGDGTYTIEGAARPEPGTTVSLHLKPSDTDDALDDYTDEWKIREIVKKYSDFVAYPIRMKVERHETEREADGKPKPGAEEKVTFEDQTLNSMKAIWMRPTSEVTDEEYNEFYKHISHDWSEPLKHISMKAEGTNEFRALLFIPSKAPFGLFMRDMEHGIHLYIRRVYIMSDCKELLPEYLRFVRGVVDSEDLSLNISREILQKNRQIQVIRKGVVKKVFDTLKQMQKDESEKYGAFWKEFGRVLKEGLFLDAPNRDALLDLCLFHSTHSPDAPTTLQEYVDRMKPGQEEIYFMTGQSRQAAENSPHLEAFRDKGYEVLLLTDPVDEVWTPATSEYKGKSLHSVGKGDVELGSEEERKKAEDERKEKDRTYKPLLETLKSRLEEHVKEVRLSARLTSSPACLVGDSFDMSPMMEAIMRANGQNVPHAKRILEVNANHPILDKLEAIHEQDKNDPRIADFAELLFGQAVLAEGGQLPDGSAFSRKLTDLMNKAL